MLSAFAHTRVDWRIEKQMSRSSAALPLSPPRKRKRTRKDTELRLVPDNDIDVKLEGSSGETVNQRRLREFYELQKDYYSMRDRYMKALTRIQDLIIGGAAIQQGTYKVQYGVRLVRRPRYKQVVIDLKGEAYQQRVLEETLPHATFRVRVE